MITLALCLANTGILRSTALNDAQYPRPVAIGACQWDDSGVFAEYRSYIRQEDKSISASAEKLHGISDRIAKSRGVHERCALSWLTNSLRTSKRVVGWDLDFDLDVIRAALVRYNGDPAELIRPKLETKSLVGICATIMGKQDANGEAVAPTIAEALTVIAPDAGIDPSNPKASAEACRVMFERLCAENLISDMREAA